jgi:hypothetical protein
VGMKKESPTKGDQGNVNASDRAKHFLYAIKHCVIKVHCFINGSDFDEFEMPFYFPEFTTKSVSLAWRNM